MTELAIAADDPRAPDVAALLERHLRFAHEHSPIEDVHALDLAALLAPSITFCSCRSDGSLLGVGALLELDPDHGELKSMHTAVDARGRGVGRAMVLHLLALARRRSYRRVSLETGTTDAFAAARTLYASEGFVVCPPFNGYRDSPHSVCMTLELGG